MKRKQLLILLWCVLPLVAPAQDLLIADFEGSDYGDWMATGDAFGLGPAPGTLPNQMHVEGYLGHGLINSFHKGDGSTGALVSPPFKVERSAIRFLIGGGGYAGETCLNLLVAGEVVRSATGPNTQAGGSERLDWRQWDVTDLAGKEAILQIIDRRTGGWGHINVDHILQTDTQLPVLLTNATRQLTLRNKYLNLPVKDGAPKKQIALLVNGKIERQFEMELADSDPDWWAFLDLKPYDGKVGVIQIDRLAEDSSALKLIEQSDTFPGGSELYREKLRPQFHFTTRRGWNNDPNGLVVDRGEYHLFYQHNPYGWNWGNMHWGHATSRDLVHWEELDEALYPDEMGTMFSGSAVFDYQNTTGFGHGNEPPLVCIYTAAGGTSQQSKNQPFTQCLAYSLDRGRSWTKYEGNPVLPTLVAGNRDPKVIWHEPEKKWIMALYLDKSDFALFESPNMKNWSQLCKVTIPGSSECPEFFEIPMEGEEPRWIFYGGNGRYLIGQFDGRVFTRESGPHELNFGNCFYASQTYNTPHMLRDSRILVAWGRINFPGMPFNQMMDFPVELKLVQTEAGPRLSAWPVPSITTLRANTRKWTESSLTPGTNPLSELRGELWDIEASFSTTGSLTFNLRGVDVTCDLGKGELRCLDRKAALKSGPVRLRMLVDRASVEIFANDIYMPMGVVLDPKNLSISARAEGEPATLHSLEAHELKSAWQ